ncbi:TIGR03086 family protein [Streptomyces agglomeratus]|uniref:TIGR03086 family protein n=1 Tax=Streptomyces agglomeratus TaxID=285458 RepID=A0A1E5P3U1_9ACTN|nr:TIGR03086 family metal-binding protein [Streptomyces agglomeratus]OEJ24211.1 TIGR03086 family protein [Streptomyces agglomeratus]OEJ54276.1 TIGR03086 family protein [Streptomyces agglomeratus]
MNTMDSNQNPLLTRHSEALALFGGHVHAVRENQWQAPTPCTDWSVRDLVNHLTLEQLWVPPLVTEQRPTEEGAGGSFGFDPEGDVLGDDPVAAWDRAAADAREAFGAPGALERTVRLSYGETPCSAYCSQMVADLVVHAWDLARAIGADERLPEDLVNFAVREVGPYSAELEKSGLFAAPVEPPPGADVQTKLLNLLGRRV